MSETPCAARVAIAIALSIAAASAAVAQPPPRAPLPADFERVQITPAPLFQTIGLACTRERAYVRDWRGAVAEWDGRAWALLPEVPGGGAGGTIGTTRDGTVVIAAGAGLARWDGRAWQRIAVDPWLGAGDRGVRVDAISGLGSAWVVGRGAIGVEREGTVRAYDLGEAWYAIHDLEVLAPERAYVAGAGGLLRWDGRAWAREATGLAGEAYDVLASGPDDVWVLGREGVARWDGRAWSVVNDGLDVGALPAPRHGQETAHLGGASPRDVYLVLRDRVLRFEGGRWAQVLDGTQRSGFGGGWGGVCATDRHVVIEEGGHALIIARH